MIKNDKLYLQTKLDDYCMEHYGILFKVASELTQRYALSMITTDARARKIITTWIYQIRKTKETIR